MARPVVRILFVSALAVSSACAAPPPPAPAPAPAPIPVASIHRKAAPTPVARPEATLVEDLDRGIQARFKNVRSSDIVAGRLGVSRVAKLDRVDRGLIHPELQKELRTMEGISKAGWDSALYVVEGVERGRRVRMISGPIVAQEELWTRFQAGDGIRELALRAMASKEPERGAAIGMALEARPILASEASCLRCHRRNELGDPLGAVVYAFRTRPLLSDAGR
jgi:hypothetical protein